MGEPDFSGYATKAGLRCSDGRTIMPDAFAHQDTQTVPLVWAHMHNDPENVLGHAVLEAQPDGVRAHGYFNNTPKGQSAKLLVEHGDVKFLSIYANQLVERSKQVFHGAIREVSLVLAGANPGAKIDYVAVQHSDGTEEVLADEARIFTGVEIQLAHSDSSDNNDNEGEETVKDVYDSLTDVQKEVVHQMLEEALELRHAEGEDGDDGETVKDVYNTFTPKQKEVVHYMIGQALEAAEGGEAKQSALSDNNSTTEGDLIHKEGDNNMPTHNVFDQNDAADAGSEKRLTHDQFATMVTEAQKGKTSLKETLLAHADEYGITDINFLFPDAKTITNTPEFVSRRMEWVSVVLGGTKHSPFAKVKTVLADITADEARAKGYMKGNLKKEEVIKLLRRTTSPATIYKKQKLDRDDIIDITDMDVVAWLKAEMRLMIEEEIARAILVGDGRNDLDDDKVKDPAGANEGEGIRSILHDSDLYSVKVEMAANTSPKDAVKELVRARSKYRGTGKPTLFISDNYLTDIMLEEDKFGRALYETEQALMDKLRVDRVVTVDLFDEYDNLFAIMVSLRDYTVGANRGGELTNFEDFDIDFNQQKYLQETRLSGGLTKPFSAVVVRRAEGTLATATAPSFDGETNTITVPTATGVVYTIDDEVVTGNVVITSTKTVEAHPAEGYYLESNTTRDWTFTP